MPDHDVPLLFDCPRCHAVPGQRCTGTSRAVQYSHQPRQDRHIRATRRAMTGPSLQRFGGMVMVQGVAVADAYYLLSVGLRAVRRGTTPIPGRFVLLQAALAAASAEARAVAASGQHDVAPVAPQPHSAHEDNIGTGEAARILRLSHRQVQRLAAGLDGRIIGGCWVFDRLAVQSYAHHRDQHRSDTAA